MVAPSTPVNTKLPYWAPTPEEVQGTQVVTTPSRTLSMRGRKPVVASKATPTPSPAQAIPRKPVPPPTTPARKFSYEPVVGNPYAETITTKSRNPLRAYPAANKRSSSPPYVPTGRTQSPEQIRPLSPGSIFANRGTQPAPPATRNFAAVSRGIGSLKKASSTVKQASSTVKKALTPQHEPKISSPIAGSFQRGFPEGHALAPEYVAPLNLVGLDVAQADTARYGQPAIQFSTGPGAGETTRITATRADSYRRLTGEQAPANLGSPSPPPAINPAPPAANPTPSKTTVSRKAVESTFGDIMDAGMDASWVPNPRAGLDRPPPVEKSFAWPWTKGKGKASVPEAPTDTPPPPTPPPPSPPPPSNHLTAELNPFAALGSAAQMFKKQGQANQPLPSTSAPQNSAPPEASLVPKPLAPRHVQPEFNTSQAVQLASQAPLVPGTDFTQDLRDRRTSQHLRVTCTACGKLIFAAAVASHRCAKSKMTEAEKAAFNPRFSQFFPASKKRGGEQGDRQVAREAAVEDERPEVFLDTYVQAATTVWRTVTRQ
jgi:hypothetical protein